MTATAGLGEALTSLPADVEVDVAWSLFLQMTDAPGCPSQMQPMLPGREQACSLHNVLMMIAS
jgi:hypothetical protein